MLQIRKSLELNCYVGLLIFFLSVCSIQAATLFEEDFETLVGGVPAFKLGPNPVLQWPFATQRPPGHLLGVSYAIKHRGKAALRVKFDGSNGLCNACFSGVQNFFMKTGINGTQFVDENGTNFNDLFPTLPDTEARVFNRDDRQARWQVQSISTTFSTGDTLNFIGNAPVRNENLGAGTFTNGDRIDIVPYCPNGEKRSDCNGAIGYLDGIEPDMFEHGETLARRLYIYVPSETILPTSNFKIAYTRTKKPVGPGGVNMHIGLINRGATRNIYSDHTSLHNREFHRILVGFERDTWYYIEEVWKRETAATKSDGEYYFYIHPVSSPTNSPALAESGIFYGERMTQLSIVGNWQSNSDSHGYIYIDDVKIATERIGPTGDDIVPFRASDAAMTP